MPTGKHRPLERFWPYAELPEQPTDEELAALDPELHEALFGASGRPFSFTIVFPVLDVPDFADALTLAKASAEFRETGSGAAHRFRARYLAQYNRPGAEPGWTFLHGSNENIHALANAVGFTYNYNEARGEYVHPAALTLLAPDGKVARYLYGLEYPDKTLRLGLVEASEGRVGSSLDRLVLYCFHYDSTEGRYAPIAARIMQLGGGVSLALFAGFLMILIRRDKKRTLVESTAQ